MATWSQHELRKIAESDDLHISPFREDGVTYGTPTWIGSVAVDDPSTSAGTTARNLLGTRPPSNKRPVVSLPPASRKEVAFAPVEGAPTTASAMPIARNTRAAHTSVR
jgi:hypothetical protein